MRRASATGFRSLPSSPWCRASVLPLGHDLGRRGAVTHERPTHRRCRARDSDDSGGHDGCRRSLSPSIHIGARRGKINATAVVNRRTRSSPGVRPAEAGEEAEEPLRVSPAAFEKRKHLRNSTRGASHGLRKPLVLLAILARSSGHACCCQALRGCPPVESRRSHGHPYPYLSRLCARARRPGRAVRRQLRSQLLLTSRQLAAADVRRASADTSAHACPDADARASPDTSAHACPDADARASPDTSAHACPDAGAHACPDAGARSHDDHHQRHGWQLVVLA